MNKVAELVDRLLARRVKFSISGNQVRVHPLASLTPEEVQVLRDGRDELFRVISNRENGHGVVIRTKPADPAPAAVIAPTISDAIDQQLAEAKQREAAGQELRLDRAIEAAQPSSVTRTVHGSQTTQSAQQPRQCQEWAGCFVSGGGDK